LTLDDDGVEQRVMQVFFFTAYGFEIPEQGQVQNCSFSFQATIKTNLNENEANNRITNNTGRIITSADE
jgi:hypothetical protein